MKCNMTDNRVAHHEYIWYSVTHFKPLQGVSCGHMYIGHINTVEFDFVWKGRVTEDESEMFFRVGFDSFYGHSCRGQASQYPSFWISPDDDYFMIGVSDSDSCTQRYYLHDYGDITLYESHHILIYWDDDILTVNITGGGKDDYYRIWNKSPARSEHIGAVVPVWFMSSKFGSTEYNKANGKFSNIIIKSHQFSNTMTPTRVPTTNPTLIPTEIPIAPTMYPIVVPTMNPTFFDIGDERKGFDAEYDPPTTTGSPSAAPSIPADSAISTSDRVTDSPTMEQQPVVTDNELIFGTELGVLVIFGTLNILMCCGGMIALSMVRRELLHSEKEKGIDHALREEMGAFMTTERVNTMIDEIEESSSIESEAD